MQTINSDYEAKRFCDMAMKRLVLHIAPKNTFMQWLRQKNKVSAQQKVPRLSNHRLHLEEILKIL
ncbi:MAG: GH3 auxin-responsive promoter family protein [Saprospiraceae bacterium]|nr:GH3 auxin-responsive promoter family protein [Saprospiraceae bacterium]